MFGLIPIMAEVYNLGTPEYYAVGVVKIRDNSSELIYLKKQNSCHTGIIQDTRSLESLIYLVYGPVLTLISLMRTVQRL